MAIPQERHPAEDFLVEQGHIGRRTIQRRKVLGCVGCHLLQTAQDGGDAVVYGYAVAQCTGLGSPTVLRSLNELAQAGVMEREREAVNPTSENLPPRMLYRPADTALGEEFVGKLHIPAECYPDL